MTIDSQIVTCEDMDEFERLVERAELETGFSFDDVIIEDGITIVGIVEHNASRKKTALSNAYFPTSIRFDDLIRKIEQFNSRLIEGSRIRLNGHVIQCSPGTSAMYKCQRCHTEFLWTEDDSHTEEPRSTNTSSDTGIVDQRQLAYIYGYYLTRPCL